MHDAESPLPTEPGAGTLTPDGVALALSGVPLAGSMERTADACVEAARALLGGPVALSIPRSPVPLERGDRRAAGEPLARFDALGGEGTLWADAAACARADGVRDAFAAQLARIWEVHASQERLTAELSQLRFHLNALQQVARTLSVVRAAEETERLILDSVCEVFFAWWAALYATDGDQFVARAVRTPRSESLAWALPTSVVRRVIAPGDAPVVPPEDAEIRDQMPAEVGVMVPLDFGEGRSGLLILGPRISETPYEAHDLALLRALADASGIALRNAELHDRLRAQATLDPLTGCHNRRGFDELLAVELTRAKRYDRPLSLVLLDIDHFKAINDRYGHEVGDRALQRIGRAVRHAFRQTDHACRFGGEEFALIFPETPKDEGLRLAERLRHLVASLEPTPELPAPLTASFGVATCPEDGDDAADLVRAADRALYQAKANGRNRIEAA